MLGANFGIPGRYCGDELKQRLMDRSAGKFSVLDRLKMQQSLVAVNFKTKDLESDSSLRNLAKSAVVSQPLQPVCCKAVQDGSLRNRPIKTYQRTHSSSKNASDTMDLSSVLSVVSNRVF